MQKKKSQKKVKVMEEKLTNKEVLSEVLELNNHILEEGLTRTIYTICTLSVLNVEDPNRGALVSATGISRRGYGDKYNKEVGYQIAYGRALKTLHEKVQGMLSHKEVRISNPMRG